MKRQVFLFLIFLLVLSACSDNVENTGVPDHVFKNAKIWTGDQQMPWASWVAVKGEQIVALGGEGDTPPNATAETDLKGQLMVPGFNDSHVHFASAGALLLGINLLDVNNEEKFVERVRETTERLPKGSWITRGDWGAYEAWGAGSAGEDNQSNTVFTPHRSMIDDITPNHPVLVVRYDRTEGLANALALKELGIESESGILEGEVLREALRQVPEKSFERRLAESRRALEECRKWGITTVQDMSPLDQVDVYNHLYAKGDLSCRINFAPARLSEYENMMAKGWIVDWEGEMAPHPTGGDWISFGTIKSHIDGIMGARTARFFQPYSDNIAEQMDWRGGWREFSKDMPSFKEMLVAADSGGIQLRVHAIGDQANALLLDILDTLDHFNGPKDRRFRLVHAQVISPMDFQRFQGRNIVAEVQPYHVTDDMRWMEERIGYERCKGAYAFKTLQENGCILSFGSDWPGTNASYYPINPLMGLYAAVTRQTVKGEPAEGWFPEQRLSLEKALRAYTWGAAYGAFEEDTKGTIEAGKLADFSVIDTDLFTTSTDQWLEAGMAMTIVGGKIVYEQE
ncbi:MAG: amidohydrolase [Saprospiraceae bacterium]|nr:amidohydrolase [Saprospiraceae bacterium]